MSDLLRFVTAGSVDDGKSTLIGRLLHDTGSLTEDQMQAIAQASRARGLAYTDLSLLTDGLLAEREQGITIDVAYRYFATATRKYIVADCPGHRQYTRNMVTGASNATVAVLLVDAGRGILEQTRRHAAVCGWLGLTEVILAVNKMDRVGFDAATFEAIATEFQRWCAPLGIARVRAIPVSALTGDMVVHRGAQMDWYLGPTLLEALEATPAAPAPAAVAAGSPADAAPAVAVPPDVQVAPQVRATVAAAAPAVGGVLAVQNVLRSNPHEGEFLRVYAGRVAGSALATGDEVVALPSGQRARIRTLRIGDRVLAAARVHDAVTVELDREIDLQRGDVLVSRVVRDSVEVVDEAEVEISWFSAEPLAAGSRWRVRIGTRELGADVTALLARLDLTNLQPQPLAGDEIDADDLARVRLRFDDPVVLRRRDHHSPLGRLLLVDEASGATVGAGLVC